MRGSNRTARVWGRRVLLLGASLLGPLLWSASEASAHAYLVSSSPLAGARLGTTPGVVVLRFSEPLQPDLSRVTVTSPDGRQVTGSEAGTSMTVALATNAPGGYQVSWKAVSAEDGHETSGSYQFAVSTARGPSASTGGGTPAWQSVLFATGRTVQYAGLLVAAGLLVLAGAARRTPELAWVRSAIRIRLRAALLIAFISTLAVVLGETAAAEGSLSVGSVARFLSDGLPGSARLSLICFEGLALASVMAASWLFTAVLLSVALVGAAAASHAAAVHPIAIGIAVDAIHLLAAAVWAGGILALVTLRPPGGWRGAAGRALLERFSAVAIPGFAVSVGFGAIQGLQEVHGRVGRLFTTSYGLVLMLKVAAILAMVPLSWFAWRRRVFRLTEALIALGVIAVAGALSVLPVPSAASNASRPLAQSGLPNQGDLTLGDHAGQFLVGISVHPAEPGPNEVHVYIKPVEGRAAGVPVDLTVGGSTTLARSCGPTCRSARLSLRGGERLVVSVTGSKGGEATFTVPSLPAPDGGPLLQLMDRRMHALKTYRLAETLSSGLGVTIPSDYSFEAPNRMTIVTRGQGVTRSIWIGSTRWLKQPGKAWQVERGGFSQRVPTFIWDYFHPQIDPRIVGRQIVDGVQTRILAFYANQAGTPIWFRLWVDAGGVVHRAHMRAFGHFMDHRYYAFDQPVSIVPPAG